MAFHLRYKCMEPDDIQPYSARLQAALDAARTVSQRGYSLVPLNPTQAMIAAGARAGGISFEQAEAVYRAMLAAEDAGSLQIISETFLPRDE